MDTCFICGRTIHPSDEVVSVKSQFYQSAHFECAEIDCPDEDEYE